MRFPSKAVLTTAGSTVGAALAASIYAAWNRNSPRPAQPMPWRPRLEPSAPKKLGVVLNPVKNRADAARTTVVHAARAAGWDRPTFYETTQEDPGYSQARQALEEGCEIVIAAGGDGTVRAVATALAETETVMGVVPLGTGNLLARNLEMPYNDLSSCVDSALHGTARSIDMVGVQAQLEDGSEYEDSFLVMGGAGFDAQVMTDTRDDLKSRWGWLAYVEAGARNLVSVRHNVRVTIDDQKPFVRRTRSVLLANCGELQAGIRIAHATADDDRLETVLLSPRNLFGWAVLAVQLMTRRRGFMKVIEHFGGESVHVDFMNHAQPMELDGDYIGDVSTVRATVRKKVLAVNTHPSNERPFRALMNLHEEITRSWR